jgi:tripartite-type tricarboxylate transporter receptor subunit TctC
VAGELLKAKVGVNMVHVPYRGGAPMVNDLLGGQVQVGIDVVAASLPHIRSGALRALAVTTAARLEALPDVATVAETTRPPPGPGSGFHAARRMPSSSCSTTRSMPD